MTWKYELKSYVDFHRYTLTEDLANTGIVYAYHIKNEEKIRNRKT